MGKNILNAAKKKIGTGIKRNANSINAKKDATHEYRLGGKGGAKSDTDGDGFMEIDCSGLVSDALKDAGYTMGSFGTHDLFNGNALTSFARKHFDVISEDGEDLSNLKIGDLILFKNNTNSGQHIAIFSGYNNGKITFYGSQTSTGPATVDLSVSGKGDIWNNRKNKVNTFKIIGTIRAKPQSKPQTEDTTQDDTQPSSPPPQSSSHSQTPLGARQDSKYKVISTSPSVNKTPRGKSTPPVPYGVQQDLSGANATMPDVLLNDKPAYVKSSNSTKVTGDSAGSAGGVKSGTVGGKSEPIEASPSVFINGQPIVRVGDMQHMQNKNTVGKIVSSESNSGADSITDKQTMPPPIKKPYAKNKPTNNPSTQGKVGSYRGSPVLLGSGRLYLEVTDMSMFSKPTLAIKRSYLSHRDIGLFGRGWDMECNTKLIHHSNKIEVVFTNALRFEFEQTNDGKFKDSDNLGATLIQTEDNRYKLIYHKECKTQYFVNNALVKIDDNNNNFIHIIRDFNARIISITSSTGGHLKFEYNSFGCVDTITDHTKRTWQYSYDRNLSLTDVIDPLGGMVMYQYKSEAPFLLTYCFNANKVQTYRITYDSSHKVSSYTNQYNQTYSYQYQKNRVIKTDYKGDITYYGVDDFGAIHAITYPDGTGIKEVFENNQSTFINKGDYRYIQTFDANQRVVSLLYPSIDKREITYTYEGDNPFASIIKDIEIITKYSYDERYNLLSIAYFDNTTKSYEYDTFGNITSYTDTLGAKCTYTYSPQNLCISKTDAFGLKTEYLYDSRGNLTTIIKPDGFMIAFGYDALDRMIEMNDQKLGTIAFVYDRASNIIMTTTTYGTNIYSYDSCDRLVGFSDYLRRDYQYTYEYDLLKRAVCNGMDVVLYEYDNKQRIIQKTHNGIITSYSYDSCDNLLSISNPTCTTKYIYNINGQVDTEISNGKKLMLSHDRYGHKRYLGHIQENISLITKEDGTLEKILQGARLYNFKYDKNHNISDVIFPNNLKLSYEYNSLGLISTIKLQDEVLFEYKYNKRLLIGSINDKRYIYDKAARLKEIDHTVLHYDEFGLLQTPNHKIDSHTKQVLYANGYFLQYDSLGNITKKYSTSKIYSYRYNPEGLLEQYEVYDIQSDTALKTLRFSYDP